VDKNWQTEYGPVAPDFARYGDEKGAELTRWLFADPIGNPLTHNKPDEWAKTGAILSVKRRVFYDNLATGTNNTTRFNPGGGKNVILMDRRACGLRTAPTAQIDLALINVQVTREDQVIIIEDVPAFLNFGSGAWPDVDFVPEPFRGNLAYNVQATNNSGLTLDIYLEWSVLMLDLGR
tara:strand:+ start:593 stop:1126 length:534 start_codon:yes stop_codon:yes gene_type:complete